MDGLYSSQGVELYVSNSIKMDSYNIVYISYNSWNIVEDISPHNKKGKYIGFNHLAFI